MIERSLVLIKPDGVRRALSGEIISRFERRGLKVVGIKMVWVDEHFASKHYDDVLERHGEKIFKGLVRFIKEGPLISMVLEGVDAISVIRSMVGSTEPKSASPGTIRGDYSHMSYGHADEKDIAFRNLIHASANVSDAKKEIALWFSDDQMHSYKLNHEGDVQ